jgi:DNA repair protein RadC
MKQSLKALAPFTQEELGSEGHRARLKQRFTETAGIGLADYELLELALMFAIPRKDVKPLAKSLLVRFGSLGNVLSTSQSELAQHSGLGDATILFLQVVNQLAQRVRKEKINNSTALTGRLELVDYLYTVYAGKTREEFVVIYLDKSLHLIASETLFTGTLAEVSASPREVLRNALNHNAAGIVVAHNHSSGQLKPSRADLDFTRQLMQACAAMGIELHDHIIVGTEAHFSFRANGQL